MLRISLLLSFLNITIFTFGQNVSTTNIPDSHLVRGFYKTYQEFLANKPSVQRDFSVVLLKASKKDASIVGAEYVMQDSLDDFGERWGFCDGQNVFVANGGFSELKYWKIQCPGPNPFFYFVRKPFILAANPLSFIIGTAVSFAMPPFSTLKFVDKEGNAQETTKANLKKLFKDNTDLNSHFKSEQTLTTALIIKYILMYNGLADGNN